MTTATPVPNVKSFDVDIYSSEAIDNPYPNFAKMREAGSVVWLEKYGIYAIPRYAAVRAAAINWKAFSSEAAVCVEPEFNEFYRGTVLATDPPVHDQLRKVLSERLSPQAIKDLQVHIEDEAEKLVAGLAEKGSFDAVKELAQPFPLKIVSDLIGLPEDGRDGLLERADASFNLFGPKNDRAIASLSVFGDTFEYISQHATQDRLTPGSLGASIYEAADKGLIGHDQVVPLLLAYLFAAMDTTVNAIGHSVWLFGRYQDQWRELRQEPELVESAFEEVLRYESPSQGFMRNIVQDIEVDGITLPEGSRVFLMYGSANRDDEKYSNAEAFDFRRNPADNMAFGIGKHHCAGQGLARIEGRAILGAMIRHFEEFEIGDEKRHYNNAIRGLGSLPTKVTVRAR